MYTPDNLFSVVSRATMPIPSVVESLLTYAKSRLDLPAVGQCHAQETNLSLELDDSVKLGKLLIGIKHLHQQDLYMFGTPRNITIVSPGLKTSIIAKPRYDTMRLTHDLYIDGATMYHDGIVAMFRDPCLQA